MTIDDYYTQVREAEVESAFEYINAIYNAPMTLEDGNRARGLKETPGHPELELCSWNCCSGQSNSLLSCFETIEKLWKMLKQHLRHCKHTAATLAELKKEVQEELDKLNPSEWGRDIDELGDRLSERKMRRGLAASYWVTLYF